jgi:hypothetical protein
MSVTVCPVHGNPLPADAAAWDTTMCGDRRCWEAVGLTRPPRPATPVARKPLPVCPHLDAAEVRLPGSVRAWRKCLAGYGSTADDARKGLVCGCAAETPGVWRRGKECGTACPGFPKG